MAPEAQAHALPAEDLLPIEERRGYGHVLPLIEGSTYSWRVRARSIGLSAPGALGQGPWSPARSFVAAAQSRLSAAPGAGATGAAAGAGYASCCVTSAARCWCCTR